MVIRPSEIKNILDKGSPIPSSPSTRLNNIIMVFPHQVLYPVVSSIPGLKTLLKALIIEPVNPAIANCGKNQGSNLNVALYPPSPIC